MLRYIENIEENLILEQYIRNCNYNKKYNVGKKLWTIDSVLGIKNIHDSKKLSGFTESFARTVKKRGGE